METESSSSPSADLHLHRPAIESSKKPISKPPCATGVEHRGTFPAELS